MIWQWLAIFSLNVFLDVIWAQYTIQTNRLNKVAASNWAVGIIVVGGFSILMYVNNPWCLIPAAAGAWIGTYITIDLQKFNDESGKGANEGAA